MSSSSSRRSRSFHVRRQPVVVDIGCSCRKPKLFSLLNLSRYSSSSSSNNKYSSESSTCSLTTTITNSTFSPCNDPTTTTSSSSSSSYYAAPGPGPGPGRSPIPKKKKKKKKMDSSTSTSLLMAEESVAVEKVSSDPYLDFKESMLQMIVEKEIYQWEDLRELLNLFLSLNSPYHHHLILRAFAEIWQGLFSPGPAHASYH